MITTGTDTMEELAVLCAMIYGGEAPIVLTGANRPASNPGADGPANLLDAVALAASPAASGLGAVVAFGGEIHAAMSVRKVDSTGPAAFGSPGAGPLGRIVEGRVWLHARPLRPAPLAVERLAHRVADRDRGARRRRRAARAGGRERRRRGRWSRSAPATSRPRCWPQLRDAAARVPVLVTCRPERSSMLFDTYGFEGAEGDVRASGAVCVPFLSPHAARIALLCCLGAGLDRDGDRRGAGAVGRAAERAGALKRAGIRVAPGGGSLRPRAFGVVLLRHRPCVLAIHPPVAPLDAAERTTRDTRSPPPQQPIGSSASTGPRGGARGTAGSAR